MAILPYHGGAVDQCIVYTADNHYDLSSLSKPCAPRGLPSVASVGMACWSKRPVVVAAGS
jgi:hypothetical protein